MCIVTDMLISNSGIKQNLLVFPDLTSVKRYYLDSLNIIDIIYFIYKHLSTRIDMCLFSVTSLSLNTLVLRSNII